MVKNVIYSLIASFRILNLHEVCVALHCTGPAPNGAEFPSHCHPLWDAPVGEAFSVPAV